MTTVTLNAPARPAGRSALRPAMPASGFTLLEMVVAVMVIAILAAIAAPRYADSIAVQRVEAAAQRVAADLALAQKTAKFTSASRTVTFDTETSSYALVDQLHLNRSGAGYAVNLGREPYQAVIVSADFGGDETVVFNGFGDADSSGSVTIAVGGHQRTISVTGDSGGVEPVRILGGPSL